MALAAHTHSNNSMQHSDAGHGKCILSHPRNKIKLQSDAVYVVDHFYTIIDIFRSHPADSLCSHVILNE